MKFDYVIVGAGSAGCVLANRLSANGKYSVCLLEAGGKNNNPLVNMPVNMVLLMFSKKSNWLYETAPEPSQQDRKVFCPRGKGLGGSSAVNGMIYIRGHESDFDRWANEEGAKGWSFKEVLPYFKRSEDQERGESELHGTGGPLRVSDATMSRGFNELFIDAAEELGYPITDDFNGRQQEGVGYYQFTIRDGKRGSTSNEFLMPVIDRPNLTVITDAHASGIEFDGDRAVGITYLDSKGTMHRVDANKEVILSGGSFNSPQLLLLSGVGPKEELEKHGIKQKHELPGVGKNLQEHVDAVVVREAVDGKLGPNYACGRQVIRDFPGYFSGLVTRKGPLHTHGGETGGFLKSSDDKEVSDLQWTFMPAKLDDHGRNLKWITEPGYSAHVTLLRPKSRGSITLYSSDPLAAPKIHLNQLSHPDDVKDLTAGVRKTRELMKASAFDEYLGQEVFPGEGCQSDEAMEEFLRRKANHIYHPVGTCKMGVDGMAVVDPQLKVHGLKGLRVVDASVMPSLIGGNTNAPTIMIAEKASDMILDEQLEKKATATKASTKSAKKKAEKAEA